MTAAPSTKMSYVEYLAAERVSEVKHQYLGGDVFAMAGGTPEHARLAMSIGRELGIALRDRPCAVFSADLRIRVEETDRSTYPDVSVVRGKRETAEDDPDALTSPSVIVEVLSDSTEADDRGEKFAHYRRLTSLREYVLVSQRAKRIEVYRRDVGGESILSEATTGERVRLPSLGVELSVDEVYRDPLAASGT
jgi:Uma2 family endonuclease